MTVNVRQAFEFPGEYSYKATIPHEELEGLKGISFEGDIPLDIEVINRVGAVTLAYDADVSLRMTCARCLKELEQKNHYHFEHILVRELANNNDDYIVAEGDVVDMSETALTDILLELPSKVLCSEDCKGLCPVCGADLNVSDCSCEQGLL